MSTASPKGSPGAIPETGTSDSSTSGTNHIIIALIAPGAALIGTFTGGFLTNQGLERQFEDQRRAQLADIRRSTYVEFLKAADIVYARDTDPSSPHLSELRHTISAVLLIASPAVQDMAEPLYDAAVHSEGYGPARSAFIAAAQREADYASP